MAIEKKRINRYSSVIYVGGGNFFTQAKPTNFHQFWTQKILLEDETVADFKEVTAAERSAIEAADAEWTRPSEEFIAQCEHAGARYNRTTGFFELNGLTDITEAQMRDIYRYTSPPVYSSDNVSLSYGRALFRTNLPPNASHYWIDTNRLFAGNTVLEVARLPRYYSDGTHFTKFCRDTFTECHSLREITEVIVAPQNKSDSYTWYGTFTGCFELETVRIKNLYGNISFANSPLISSDSISYLVENRTTAHTDVITVTVHTDVFAKLTGDTTNPAVAALTPSELAQWQQILTAATAKNISFTTP